MPTIIRGSDNFDSRTESASYGFTKLVSSNFNVLDTQVSYIDEGVEVSDFLYLIDRDTFSIYDVNGSSGAFSSNLDVSNGTNPNINGVLIRTYLSSSEELSNLFSGVSWNSVVDTYVRTGDMKPSKIQEGMKRCVLNSDGTVNYYLHPNNSTLKDDGVTPSVLDGTDGNVMVEIPKFYYKYTTTESSKKAEISLHRLDGFALHPAFIKNGVEVDHRYYRAYEGFNSGGTLISRSGVTPTRSFTFPVGRTLARANGTGWGLIDWNLLHAVQLLYFIEFANFDAQSIIGRGNDTGSNYGITTGQSNGIGNASSGKNNNNMWMSYRGIENWYADIWEMIDGINIQNRLVYLNQNQSTFASDVFTGDYVSTGTTLPVANASYIKNINFSEDGFIPTEIGGSSSTYVTDGIWTDTGNRVMYFGGHAAHGTVCGAFCGAANVASSNSAVNIGASVSF